MKAVILAAGVGRRLGEQMPKCLNKLPSGLTIIENQIFSLEKCGIKEIFAVVGFKKEIVMENYHKIFYVYNPFFHITNTAKSLLCFMERIEPDDVIWINGDVVLEEEVIKRVLEKEGNIVAVNKFKCGEEEIKYKTNNRKIIEISKEVKDGEGEAVGVNKISRKDFEVFLRSLVKCSNNDYFEKAIEISISEGIEFYPVDVTDCKCIEVDFIEDFNKAREMFR